MSTAPWWATGVFTLCGVVIAQVVTLLLSRSHDKFEDSRRWHEDRRDIYLDIVIYAWRVQDAIFDHFESDEPLPSDLGDMSKKLEAAGIKTQLIGSEGVTEVARKLAGEASEAATYAESGESGKALDACDNIRHTLYFLIDLMRADLTSNKAAVSRWHSRRRRRF